MDKYEKKQLSLCIHATFVYMINLKQKTILRASQTSISKAQISPYPKIFKFNGTGASSPVKKRNLHIHT